MGMTWNATPMISSATQPSKPHAAWKSVIWTTGHESFQPKLTVIAVSSNPQLVANPTVTYTSPNATGTLSLKTASNASGSAIITVSIAAYFGTLWLLGMRAADFKHRGA